MKQDGDIANNPPEFIFYSSAYHYRRTPVLVVSIGLILFCSPFLFRCLWEFGKIYQSPHKILIGLFPTTVLGLFVFIGAKLLRYYLTDYSLPLVIDREGVRYGDRFYPWDGIRALRGRISQSSIQLLLLRRGIITPDRYLLTNDGLSDEKYDALMIKLQTEVAPLHEHLDFA